MKGGCRSPGLCTQIHPSLRCLQLCRDRGPYGKEWEKAAEEPGCPAGRELAGSSPSSLSSVPKQGGQMTPEGQMETPGPQGWHRQDAKAGVGGAGCFSREGHGEQPCQLGASLVPAAKTLEKLTTSVITEAGGGETSKPL